MGFSLHPQHSCDWYCCELYNATDPGTGYRQGDPRAHWPASLAKMAKIQTFRKQGQWKVVEEDTLL